jgi:hypothetical protein
LRNIFKERFLLYCEKGKLNKIKQIILTKENDLFIKNNNLIPKGLKQSIKSNQIEIVLFLLEHCNNNDELREGLLLAIYFNSFQITDSILKHSKYKIISKRKFTLTDTFWQISNSIDSQFSPDITPLQLACSLANQSNRFKIVQLLFDKGHRIEKPHELKCKCSECLNRFKFDSFRHAQSRLNSYKGLTSEIYITLVSEDPIITCFNLRKEVLSLAKKENMFKVNIFKIYKFFKFYY